MKKKSIILSLIMCVFAFCMVFTTGCGKKDKVITLTDTEINSIIASGVLFDISHWSGYEKNHTITEKIASDETDGNESETEIVKYNKATNSAVAEKKEILENKTTYYFQITKVYKKVVEGDSDPTYDVSDTLRYDMNDASFESMYNDYKEDIAELTMTKTIFAKGGYSYNMTVKLDAGFNLEFVFNFDSSDKLTSWISKGSNESWGSEETTYTNYTQEIAVPSWFNASNY